MIKEIIAQDFKFFREHRAVTFVVRSWSPRKLQDALTKLTQYFVVRRVLSAWRQARIFENLFDAISRHLVEVYVFDVCAPFVKQIFPPILESKTDLDLSIGVHQKQERTSLDTDIGRLKDARPDCLHPFFFHFILDLLMFVFEFSIEISVHG